MTELFLFVAVALGGVIGFLAWRYRVDVKPHKEPTDEEKIRALAAQGVLLSEVYRRFPHIEPEYVAEIYSSRGPR